MIEHQPLGTVVVRAIKNGASIEMKDKLFEQGLKIRKQVLGAAYFERQLKNADELSFPMQMLATKWAKVVGESGAKAE